MAMDAEIKSNATAFRAELGQTFATNLSTIAGHGSVKLDEA